jgi:hypothetical protein
MLDFTVTTKPRRLSEVREDIRTMCHIAVPATGDLRTMAKHLQTTLAAGLRSDGVLPTTADDRAEKVAALIEKLAEAQDEVAKRGQILLDELEDIRAMRNRRNRSGADTDRIDI